MTEAKGGQTPVLDVLENRRRALRLRRSVLDMTHRAKSSHVGSAFSIADIVSVLYGEVMHVWPDQPNHPDRDRFVLSKGHAGACLYAMLADMNFFNHQLLSTYYMNGSILSGHFSHKDVPGVDFSTGSLGHGLGVSAGFAMASKLRGKSYRSFCLMSDGECDEGSVWEAVMFAAHHRLANLTAIIDYNKIQSLAPVSETIALEPFGAKWAAHNWHVSEVDGHDPMALYTALILVPEQPHVIIAHTTKGKGVSFMENSVLWHYRTAQGEEYEAAVAELDAAEHKLEIHHA